MQVNSVQFAQMLPKKYVRYLNTYKIKKILKTIENVPFLDAYKEPVYYNLKKICFIKKRND